MLHARRFVLVGALLAVWLLVAPLPLSAITTTQVSCATTATLVYTTPSGGRTVLIRNAGTASVFLGDASVSAVVGFELIAGAGITLALTQTNEAIYCLVATGTNRVDTVEGRR